MSDSKQEADNVDTSKLILPEVHLEQVEVRTMEEDEDVVLRLRSKLFVFISEDVYGGEKRSNYWKERGLGDVKILRHRETGKSRLLMRQEKILKICANHVIHPSTRMEPNVGSDRSWVFTAFDFADGELKEQTYAIRFKTAEQASEFKEAYESAAQANAALSTGAGESKAGAEEKAEAGATVPLVSDIKEIYGEGPVLDAACTRYAETAQAFVAKFEAAPEYFVRAPGRVNLIGEHIDYNGYSVLPMALNNDVLIAVRATGGSTISIANTEDKYQAAEFPSDPAAEVDTSTAQWSNYFQAGYKGVFDTIETAPAGGIGMEAMVNGTIPAGAGLSSSSACVVASFLATAAAGSLASGLALKDVAEGCCKSEQYVGTIGGGMDQAISCLASAGSASYISFEPLAAEPVALPEGAVFVIANSLVASEKAATASTCFNLRVVECKLAAALLAKKLGLENWKELTTLKAVQEAASLSLEAALSAAQEQLQQEAYTTESLTEALGEPLADVLGESAASVLAAASEFSLYDRASHVYGEAARVESFKTLCAESEGDSLAALGELLNASQASCKDLFQCSCPELDELTSAALAAGALGSRLTGAGWGGCTVSLVREADLESFLAQLGEAFYAGKDQATGDISEYVFASTPGSGAAVYSAAQ